MQLNYAQLKQRGWIIINPETKKEIEKVAWVDQENKTYGVIKNKKGKVEEKSADFLLLKIKTKKGKANVKQSKKGT
jgi:hypothetical protein